VIARSVSRRPARNPAPCREFDAGVAEGPYSIPMLRIPIDLADLANELDRQLVAVERREHVAE
jgi:hypothetical protein